MLLAVLTLIPYLGWFRASGFGMLEANGVDGASVLVTEASRLVAMYGTVLVLASLATAWLALKGSTPFPKGVATWLFVCLGCALVTRDVVGALLFMVTVALVMAQRRAFARHSLLMATVGGSVGPAR